MFAPAWRDRTVDEDPGAPYFNDTEQYVVASKPLQEEWAKTTGLGDYDPEAIRKLKDERDGIIFMSGSGQLVRSLLAEGLVDELHLFVYPVALGAGEKFWRGDSVKLALKAQEVFDNGVVHLTYGPA
jgi:dihydrofolate reductase